MKKHIVSVFLVVLLLFCWPVQAEGGVVSWAWQHPAPQQIAAAEECRLPLPQEKGGGLCPGMPGAAGAVTRHYVGVRLTVCRRNSWYQPIGLVRCQNAGSAPFTLTYSQGQRAHTAWNVTANLSENPALAAMVLSQVQSAAGVAVGRGAELGPSEAVLAAMTVPAGKTGAIHAFHSAVEAQGFVTWVGMDENGVICGGGAEPFGGAFIMSGVALANELS